MIPNLCYDYTEELPNHIDQGYEVTLAARRAVRPNECPDTLVLLLVGLHLFLVEVGFILDLLNLSLEFSHLNIIIIINYLGLRCLYLSSKIIVLNDLLRRKYADQ